VNLEKLLMENEELIQRLKAGDNAAYKELISLFSYKVLNTCYKFLLDKTDAEDVAQEVFIEVFQSIKSFRGDSKLSTWIYRIAVTKSLDEIKKRKRKKRLNAIGKTLHLDEITDWLSGGSMPDRSLHEQESLKEVMKALDTLPDNQRIAFTLSRIEGYSNEEIAGMMDTTIEAIESLIYRAKRKISTELENILKK
jgi:RNA polymerase sigma-70 factor, ECF subfamily